MRNEAKLMAALKRLEKLWREVGQDHWVFQSGETFHLLRLRKDGERAMLPGGHGGVDQQYIVESYNIPSDGGDW